MAVSNVANQIRNGEIEIGFAVGFESMSATCVLSLNPSYGQTLTPLSLAGRTGYGEAED